MFIVRGVLKAFAPLAFIDEKTYELNENKVIIKSLEEQLGQKTIQAKENLQFIFVDKENIYAGNNGKIFVWKKDTLDLIDEIVFLQNNLEYVFADPFTLHGIDSRGKVYSWNKSSFKNQEHMEPKSLITMATPSSGLDMQITNESASNPLSVQITYPNGGEYLHGKIRVEFNWKSSSKQNQLLANIYTRNTRWCTLAQDVNLLDQTICTDSDNNQATTNQCVYQVDLKNCYMSKISYPPTYLEEQVKFFVAIASPSYSAQDYSNNFLKIYNTVPIIEFINPAPEGATSCGEYTYKFTVADPEGDPIKYAILVLNPQQKWGTECQQQLGDIDINQYCNFDGNTAHKFTCEIQLNLPELYDPWESCCYSPTAGCSDSNFSVKIWIGDDYYGYNFGLYTPYVYFPPYCQAPSTPQYLKPQSGTFNRYMRIYSAGSFSTHYPFCTDTFDSEMTMITTPCWFYEIEATVNGSSWIPLTYRFDWLGTGNFYLTKNALDFIVPLPAETYQIDLRSKACIGNPEMPPEWPQWRFENCSNYYNPSGMIILTSGPSCTDGVKNGNETDVDCGGTCDPCQNNKSCLVNKDCESGYCNLDKACTVERNLYIEWIKPIQVVEDVPLVAGKATVVRVKVVNDGPTVDTSVKVNYNSWISEQPVHINEFDFEIVDFYPPNSSALSLTISAELNDNEDSMTILKNGVETKEFSVTFRPIFRPAYLGTSDLDFDKIYHNNKEFLKATYPVSESNFKPELWTFPHVLSPEELIPKWGLVLLLQNLIIEEYIVGNFSDKIVGIIDETNLEHLAGQPNVKGAAFYPYNTTAVVIASDANSTATHEIGHTFGLCDEYSLTAWNDQNSSYPRGCPNKFPPAGLGNIDINGFWVNNKTVRKSLPDQIFYFDSCEEAIENESILKEKFESKYCFIICPSNDPSRVNCDRSFYNFMDNKYRSWIDKSTYSYLLTQFATTPLFFSSILSRDLDQVAYFSYSDKSLLLSGLTDKNGEVTLQDFYIIDGEQKQDILAGDYSLKLLDSQNNVLLNQSFGVSFTLQSNPPIDLNTSGFVFTVPFIEETKTIEVTYHGETKAQRIVSDNPPTVSIISPNGDEKWNGIRTIRWNASDEDDDNLSFVLQYSNDTGSTWNPIAMNLSKTNYDLNVDILEPGDTYKIKAIATDGVLTGEAISNTFTIQPQDSTDIDSDGDGVNDEFDKCPNTIRVLEVYGCSCKQILELKPGKDKCELKNGCSPGTIKVFKKQIGWAKNLFE